MTDLTFSRSGELGVTEVAGNSEAGIEFVDACMIEHMVVVDAGRIIVRNDDVPTIRKSAHKQGLTTDDETRGE